MGLPGDIVRKNPSPYEVNKSQLQDPNKGGGVGAGFDERGCKEDCARRYPNHYKWSEQKELYDDCIRECERKKEELGGDGEGDGGVTEGCPPEAANKKSEHEGCECGSRFSVPSMDFPCPPGYMIVKGSKGPACRCIKWCEDQGLMPSCLGTGGGGAGGEFKWGEDVDALIRRLMGQANYLLDVPRGLTEEERDAIYNRAFVKIKGGERCRIQELEDQISRMGMLGSPFAEREVIGEKRFTGELLAGTGRDIEIEETQRRFQEMMATTQMAQQLVALGMSSEQAVEAINASRRGEGRESLNQLLSYFGMLYGGQDNSYIQAILSQFGQGGGGNQNSIWDWLPYLPYLLKK